MKTRAILFFIGVIILVLGAVPLAANVIPAAKSWMGDLPPAGSSAYQAILIVLGVVALSYSFRGDNGKRLSQNELLKAISK